mmetsp:Transcript_11300/g.15384  ORF Transcript_11300/g.15384 Transcript_11300/m.15384 type:complete len:316 (-) Transcript_11300:114-1061(-)|eukprot:CAMPEP_0196586298 /NCGR_PEP_ID=MMETSP1081-20130531/53789_1 /TAXON_ID=36882 /ORGANISM="Pyramimonas amylifera, Strain CCMP720" /LENGTH=315 /DNA_ID=CAMNT_0041908131 /DNA_START=153 /DNA_END=1100 /DNA_ORIENTATION=-
MDRWRNRMETGLEYGTRPDTFPIFEIPTDFTSTGISTTGANKSLNYDFMSRKDSRRIDAVISDSRRITLSYADDVVDQQKKQSKQTMNCRASQDPVASCILSDSFSENNFPDFLRVPKWNQRKGRKRRGARGAAPEYRKWILPILGGAEVTSLFGYRCDPLHPRDRIVKFHNGLDLAAKSGTAVLAASPGVVMYAGWKGALGLNVEVTHDDGYMTRYGHNSKLYTQVGKRVRQGDLIAAIGATGRATGPHLHFEIRKHGVSEDPLPVLSKVCHTNGSIMLSTIPAVFRLGTSSSVSMATSALVSGLIRQLRSGAF